MSSTRCEVCGQAATHKCTDCGEVFCDLHVRLAGGGMYGSSIDSIGYFCDACWEKRRRRKGTVLWVVFAVAILLLAANIAGVFVLKDGVTVESAGQELAPMIAISIGVFVVLLLGIVVMTKARRR